MVENYIEEIRKILYSMKLNEIELAIRILRRARKARTNIFIFGNGGSASTASHFTCDLFKSTKDPNLPDFKVICLSDNVSLLTAYANDFDYEDIFSQQLFNLLQAQDIAIAISSSGNSKNIVRAIDYANRSGAITIGLTGCDGGKLGKIVGCHINVPYEHVRQIEDVHLIICHMICEELINFYK